MKRKATKIPEPVVSNIDSNQPAPRSDSSQTSSGDSSQPTSPGSQGSDSKSGDSQGSFGINTTFMSATSTTEMLRGSSLRNQEITVLARRGDDGIEVLISDTRPGANIEGDKGQGDHVTAYVNFLEMICAAVDGEKIEEIPDLIFGIAKCILPESKHDEFAQSLQQFKAIQEQQYSRGQRKNLTRLLRELKDQADQGKLSDLSPKGLETITKQGTEEQISSLRNTIIAANNLATITAIQDLGEKLLSTIQQTEDIAFPKKPKADLTAVEKQEARLEGNRVKMAGYGLKALDRLIKLRADIAKLESAHPSIRQELQDNIEDFVDDLFRTRSTLKSGIKVLAESLVDDSVIDPEERKKLAGSRVDLFCREIERSKLDPQSIKTRLGSVINSIIGSDEQALGNDATTNSKMTKKVGKLFEDMFDFSYDRHKEKRGTEDPLYKVTARHLVIMFTAFKQLKPLNLDTRNGIINSFLAEGVLENEGWSKFELKDVGGKKRQINSSDMLKGLSEVSKLGENKLDGEFRMLTKQEQLDVKTVAQQQSKKQRTGGRQ